MTQDATSTPAAPTAVIGGGIVGVAIAHALAHRGVRVELFEALPDLALAASGTNSGCLHTGFDSVPGELETRLIHRGAELRDRVLTALDVTVLRCGAELQPHRAGDRETIAGLLENARENGVTASIRDSDGTLQIPGEWITNPVEFTLRLAASAEAAGAVLHTGTRVTGVTSVSDGATVMLADGRTVRAAFVVNAAGLYSDDIARSAGDDSFEIYPRKGEFFVFELPGGETLPHILLPVPTKRTKGVLVFPTVDGRVIAGPTAVDLEDKEDWSVRDDAKTEILAKARTQFPALTKLEPIFQYTGLRPAGRDTNYRIGFAPESPRLLTVAAIRSTGLSAALGIGEYAAELLADAGLAQEAPRDIAVPAQLPTVDGPWWRRTADFRGDVTAAAPADGAAR